MTFFDSTPGGALFNALNSAAESDRKTREMGKTSAPKKVDWRLALEQLGNRLHKLSAAFEGKEVPTSRGRSAAS